MKKRVLLSILAASVVLGLAACGPAATTAPPATEAPPEATEPPEVTEPEEVISLRLWTHQNEAFNMGYEALIDAYEAANPNVDITLETFEYDTYIQTLQTAMPAGEEADVLQLFGTWTSEYAERLAPAPDNIITLAEAEDTFYAAPIGGFTVDGMLYGMPQEFNCEYGGVLVNQTMFENASLAFPPEWASMDDVLSDAQALAQTDADGVMTVSGFHFASSDGAVFSFLGGIKQRGGDYWNEDLTGFTFDTAEARDQLQWMVDAIAMGVSDPVLFEDAENWVGDAFFEGRVGIGYIGTWAIAEGMVGFPDFEDEWGYAWLPPVAGDESLFVADSGWGLVVSPNSEHQDIAWDFAKFAVADPDNATQWNIASGTIPAIPEVAESAAIADAMPWVGEALDILPYGEYLGSMPDRDLVVYEIVYPHILLALQGVETVDEALAMMDAEANATFE